MKENNDNGTNKDSVICQIDFQDYFERDTISMILMDSTVIKSEVVTSDQIAGFAGISIKIKKTDDFSILLSRPKQLHWIVVAKDASFLNSNYISCKLVINHRVFLLNEDISKEKFIGISKIVYSDNSWNISIIKSNKKFLYY